MVIRSTEQTAAEVWVPGQTIALFLVASQTQIRGALSRWIYVRKETTTNPINHHLLYSQQMCSFCCNTNQVWRGVLYSQRPAHH